MPDLRAVVKAYDIRGIVPDQLDDRIARALGAATIDVLAVDRIVIAHDMRESGPALSAAFATGAASRGAHVATAGLASTDMLYFASGQRGIAGAMFTASHNPARYNGIKLCRPGAVPIGLDTGLGEIRDRAQAYLDGGMPPRRARRSRSAAGRPARRLRPIPAVAGRSPRRSGR